MRCLPLAALLIGSAACGRPPQRGTPDPAAGAAVLFTNESLEQAIIYAVAGSQSVRMGTVLPGRTERLAVPAGVVAHGTTVTFVARLLARRRASPQSGAVSVQKGDLIQLRLSSDARMLAITAGRGEP